MKATFTFDLPEDNYEHQSFLAGPRAIAVLHDLATEIRRHTKHGDPDETLTWDELHTLFWNTCTEHNIDPYEIG